MMAMAMKFVSWRLVWRWITKLTGVWLVAFVSASGAIIARRFHKERPWPPGRRP